MKWKNILELLSFFFNDSLHGFLDRPFFKKRSNRVFLTIILFSMYYYYFWLNIQQLSAISNVANLISKSTYLIAAKETLSSYYNMCIITGVFIYILVNGTFQLTNNSLHIAKTLPFSEKEIWLSQKIFKLICGVLVFEIVLIILVPSIKLITRNVFYWILLLIDFHVIFINIFLLLDLVYDFVLINPWLNTKLLATFIDTLLVLLTSIYLFTIRFKIDYLIGHIDLYINTLIKLSSFILLGMFLILLSATLVFKPQEIIVKKTKFWNLPLIKFKNNIEISFPAIVRASSYTYMLIFTLIIFMFSLASNSVESTLQNMTFIFPLIGIVGISYSDATLNFRRFFNLYDIKARSELCSLLFTGTLILLPTILLSIFELKNIDVFIFGFSIYLSSIILGFLLPKSYGSVNETMSSLLIAIIIVLLSVALVKIQLLVIVIVFLLIILIFVLKKEREKNYELL